MLPWRGPILETQDFQASRQAPSSASCSLYVEIATYQGNEDIELRRDLSQFERRRANVQPERVKDGTRPHLQAANKRGATRHDDEGDQQNDRRARPRHLADQANRAAGRSWTQPHRGRGVKPAQTTKMGSLDGGGQQNRGQAQQRQTAQPVRWSVWDVHRSRCRSGFRCNPGAG